jgi:porin
VEKSDTPIAGQSDATGVNSANDWTFAATQAGSLLLREDDAVTFLNTCWIAGPRSKACEPPVVAMRRPRPRTAHGQRPLPVLAAAIALLYSASAKTADETITQPLGPGTGVPEEPLPLPGEPTPVYSRDTNLTGDWGGLRNTLADEGFEIELGYAMEFMANPVGGESQGSTYVHNILLSLDFDLEKLISLPNSAFRIRGSQRSGNSLTNRHIGNAFSVQQLYGGGQTWRLVEVEMQHDLFDDHLNLAYGRLAATNDFLTSPLYCQFVSNAICGQPAAPFFNMPQGITAYPEATWAARARVHPIEETYLQVGVYDGDPHQGNSNHGANFTFGDNGVLILTEAGYKPDQGLLGLPAAYKIGGYYHTGDFEDVDGLRDRTDNSGVYTLIDQMLYREEPEDTQGLYGFFVLVVAPEQNRNIFPYFVSGGLIYEGLIDARPRDKVGFAVASGFFSQDLRDAQRENDVPRQYAETILELNYQYQATQYFYLRPDIQYVVDPNGYDEIDNAFVIGFEAGITF